MSSSSSDKKNGEAEDKKVGKEGALSSPVRGLTDSATTTGSAFGTVAGFSGFGTALAGKSPSSSDGFGTSAGTTTGGFGTAATFRGGFGGSSGKGGNSVFGGGLFGNAAANGKDDKNAFPSVNKSTDQVKAAESNSNPDVVGNNREDALPNAGKTAGGASAVSFPTQYECRSGEEDETLLMELRCKTYRLGDGRVAEGVDISNAATAPTLSVPPSSLVGTTTTKAGSAVAAVAATAPGNDADGSIANKAATTASRWREVGTGPLRVLRHARTNQVRLVQRLQTSNSTNPTKVLLNCPVRRESSSLLKPSEKHVQITSILPAAGGGGGGGSSNSSSSSQTFLFKVKEPEDAAHLHSCLKEQIDKAKPLMSTSTSTSSSGGTSTTSKNNGSLSEKCSKRKAETQITKDDQTHQKESATSSSEQNSIAPTSTAAAAPPPPQLAGNSAREGGGGGSQSSSRKRNAPGRITRLDDGVVVDVEEEAADTGASAEVMKKRRIVKVPRDDAGRVDWTRANKNLKTAAASASSTNNNAFSNVTLQAGNNKKQGSSSSSVFGGSAGFSGFATPVVASSAAGGKGFGAVAVAGAPAGRGFGGAATAWGSGSGGNTSGFGGFGANNARTDQTQQSSSSNNNNNNGTTGRAAEVPTRLGAASGEEDQIPSTGKRRRTDRTGERKEPEMASVPPPSVQPKNDKVTSKGKEEEKDGTR